MHGFTIPHCSQSGWLLAAACLTFPIAQHITVVHHFQWTALTCMHRQRHATQVQLFLYVSCTKSCGFGITAIQAQWPICDQLAPGLHLLCAMPPVCATAAVLNRQLQMSATAAEVSSTGSCECLQLLLAACSPSRCKCLLLLLKVCSTNSCACCR